jgi:thymidylate kinase
MEATTESADRHSAWNPGIGPELPGEFRLLETIFRPECVSSSVADVEEFASLTGFPHEELAVFRPERLVLHELIVRVTADIAVPEGEEEEIFGQNFRQIAGRIRDAYIAPRMEAIEGTYAALCRQADAAVRRIFAETLFAPPTPPVSRPFPLNLFRGRRAPAKPAESLQESEQRVVAGYKTAGLGAEDPLQRAIFKSLYRVLGVILATRGRLGADQDLLARLVCRHVCNHYGSQLIGQEIAPLVDAAIENEGYTRVCNRHAPVLISLKGPSAAGKSSLRPTLKQIMREQGIEPDGYATISPDIWRRLLLDYESLGPARKYAGQLTSRELMIIDGKLDRYVRFKANRDHAIPHILVDRFRFDSFSDADVARVLHNTYAKYVDTMYMYFIVTPPEETVERGWQRALQRGRYKAVEDFLDHSVEAYTGMPKLLFKWLAYRRLKYRYVFLDNRVPKGTFPKTIAFGNQSEITIHDPVAFIDIERYQKIDIHARSREEVYPPAAVMAASRNTRFLKECIRRIEVVNFVDWASGTAYLRARNGVFEVLDTALFARVLTDEEAVAVFGEIAPRVVRNQG